MRRERHFQLPSHYGWLTLLAAGLLSIAACAPQQARPVRTAAPPPPAQMRAEGNDRTGPAVSEPAKPMDRSITVRAITDDELWRASEKDPDLSPVLCRQILARLNIRASYHISDDISKGRPLKVPNDFSVYKNWTPLPVFLHKFTHFPKSIVVVKTIFFLGWYEKGRLTGDSHICLGSPDEPTDAGVFRVLEKDAAHISRSYTNDLGQPALMPWSMKIYGNVYIHAGDITSEHCSHGCVTLPMNAAEELFLWTEPGTPVIIVETIEDLEKQPLKPRAERPANRVRSGRRSGT